MNKNVLISITATLLTISCGKAPSSNESMSPQRAMSRDYDCKLEAVEMAARVKVNINNGQSDFFHGMDKELRKLRTSPAI